MDKHYFQSPAQRHKLVKRAIEDDADDRERLKDIRNAIKGGNGALTNRLWEMLTIFLPQCVYQNPRIDVQTVMPGDQRVDAVGLKYTLESLLDQQAWLRIWQQAATDALAWRGIVMTTYDPAASYPRFMEGQTFLTWKGDKALIERGAKMTIPRMHYITPEAFFRDPDAIVLEESRFMGHCWDESVDLLQAYCDEEPDEWIRDAVQQLKSRGETGKVRIMQMYTPHFIDPEAVNNYKGDEDPKNRRLYTGTIYTMLADGEHAYRDIRKPRLYRGPAGGLYSVAECVPCPGGGKRIAPFSAAWEQIELDAKVGKAVVEACASYKRGVIASNEIGEAIRDMPHDGILDVEVAASILQDAIKEFSIGGPSPELLQALEISGTAADRTGGMSDTLRQNAGRDTTATAEQFANQAYNARTGLYASPIFDMIDHSLSTAAHYIEHSEDFIMALPDEASSEAMQAMKRQGIEITPEIAQATMGMPVVYTGGNALRESDEGTATHPFDGKTIRTVAFSMSRTNEGLQQKRILDSSNLVLQAVQIKSAYPDFDLPKYLNDMGAKLNLPDLGGYFEATGQTQQTGGPEQMNTETQDPMRQMAQLGAR